MDIDRAAARPRRRGTTILEVTVTAVLLGAALVLVARVVGGMAAAGESAERRRWALDHAQNTLERLSALPLDDLNRPDVATRAAEAATQRAADVLPGGQVEVTVERPEKEGPESRRVAVAVRWDGPSGQPTRPVRLVAWVYPRPAGGGP